MQSQKLPRVWQDSTAGCDPKTNNKIHALPKQELGVVCLPHTPNALVTFSSSGPEYHLILGSFIH